MNPNYNRNSQFLHSINNVLIDSEMIGNADERDQSFRYITRTMNEKNSTLSCVNYFEFYFISFENCKNEQCSLSIRMYLVSRLVNVQNCALN